MTEHAKKQPKETDAFYNEVYQFLLEHEETKKQQGHPCIQDTCLIVGITRHILPSGEQVWVALWSGNSKNPDARAVQVLAKREGQYHILPVDHRNDV